MMLENLERWKETRMEIGDLFRNFSPCIQRSMGELPVIHIPDNERILACHIEHFQGERLSLLLSFCTIQDRHEVSTDHLLALLPYISLQSRVIGHSGFSPLWFG